MARQRNPTARAVLLSDELSRLLLRQAHQRFADAGGPSGAATTSPTAPPEVAAAPRKVRRKLVVGTAFRCPICKRAESVGCRIDPRRRVAEASCRECEASYSAAVADALTEPIDVYCEWIDERRRAGGGGGGRRGYDGDVMMADA